MMSETTMTASTETPTVVRNSRWWYIIAAVPIIEILVAIVIAIVFTIVFGLGQSSFLGLGETAIAMAMAGLSILVALVSIPLPYALHRDLNVLNEYAALTEWEIEHHQYVIAGVAGIFIPIVGFAVSIYYLYQRHVHVGIP